MREQISIQRIMFEFIFGDTIDKKVDERVASLSGKVSTILYNLPDEVAEKNVTEYLVVARSQGTTEVSAFDVMAHTGVPGNQVARILQKFVKERNLQEA